MCGIAGFVCEGMKESQLHAMLESMKARGPDGVGEFHSGNIHLGMRRLSIIDVAHGGQPLYARGRSVVAFQNGEIYNYRALRTELEGAGCEFRTESDTEVLAHGYAVWGWEGLLERLDGMYALAVMDKERNALYLARDRFGEKPLFFSHSPKAFGYASNLLSMSAMPWVSDEWDVVALDYYLALHFVPGPRTILRDVRQLLPGEALELDLSSMRFKLVRYYAPRGSKERDRVSAEDLSRAVELAVTSRLVSDVPVGVFLSGGLDSSLVAAIAARERPGIKTFSMGFRGCAADESAHAERLATHIGSTHETFQFDGGAFRDLLPKVAEVLDTPIGDQALLPVYWLAREASREVKVVLSGEGADEIFGGYGYYRQFVEKMNVKAYVKGLLRRVRASTGSSVEEGFTALIDERRGMLRSGFPILMSQADRRKVLEGLGGAQGDAGRGDKWAEDLVAYIETDDSALRRATLYDLCTWLPDDLLVKFDRMAMAHSLEGRAPFLFPMLAEMGIGLKERDRVSNGVSKVALRRVAKAYLPRDLLERPKQGFVLPMSRWLSEWFSVHGGASRYFSEKRLYGLNFDHMANVVGEDIRNGVRRERMVFSLVMLVEWWDAFERKRRALRVEMASDS